MASDGGGPQTLVVIRDWPCVDDSTKIWAEVLRYRPHFEGNGRDPRERVMKMFWVAVMQEEGPVRLRQQGTALDLLK